MYDLPADVVAVMPTRPALLAISFNGMLSRGSSSEALVKEISDSHRTFRHLRSSARQVGSYDLVDGTGSTPHWYEPESVMLARSTKAHRIYCSVCRSEVCTSRKVEPCKATMVSVSDSPTARPRPSSRR